MVYKCTLSHFTGPVESQQCLVYFVDSVHIALSLLLVLADQELITQRSQSLDPTLQGFFCFKTCCYHTILPYFKGKKPWNKHPSYASYFWAAGYVGSEIEHLQSLQLQFLSDWMRIFHVTPWKKITWIQEAVFEKANRVGPVQAYLQSPWKNTTLYLATNSLSCGTPKIAIITHGLLVAMPHSLILPATKTSRNCSGCSRPALMTPIQSPCLLLKSH